MSVITLSQTFFSGLASLMFAASPADAAISELRFAGKGAITYSERELLYHVGAPVNVSGTINFGETPLPDRFSGTVDLNNLDDGQYFNFDVNPAQVYGWSDAPYAGGFVTLLRGRLVSVGLYADLDSQISDLYPRAFRGLAGFHSSDGIIYEWGGKWSLVPEPRSWTLMIAGFGCVGLAMRRRRLARTPHA
nr:PEPxxWA-CTERM sorting domain-containing protein [Polymorphobacter sp.]